MISSNLRHFSLLQGVSEPDRQIILGNHIKTLLQAGWLKPASSQKLLETGVPTSPHLRSGLHFWNQPFLGF